MEEALDKGLFLAGFFSYEAGYSFEKSLNAKEDFDFPLLQFGVYKEPAKENLKHKPLIKSGLKEASKIFFNLDKTKYFEKIKRIRDDIEKGETYQITFCVKKLLRHFGDSYSIYKKLLKFQKVPYPAYISTKGFDLLSLSPEMFFKKSGKEISTKPMKGTLLRDNSIFNSLFGKTILHFDKKNRAENIMITDLLRNDLGKICEKGSVKTKKIFEVAKYKTVFQMTSTVSGKLQGTPGIYEIFKALFPSGSVTGAPKIRSMEIIRELEKEERKIYTGAIGYITPGKEMFFNVPIRTILLNKKDDLGEIGFGGGITWYSTPLGEYEECLIKARFLDKALV